MDSLNRDRAAITLADIRTRVGRLAPLPTAQAPRNETDAYAVQDMLRLHLAGRGLGGVAGYKIGCTTQVMQSYLGIDHPCAGGMSLNRIYQSGHAFDGAAFVRPGVECEIAVELVRDLPVTAAPFDRASAAAAVGSICAAVEIVDDRYVDWRAMDVPTLIADDFFHAALVLGPRIADWRGFDLGALTGVVRVNGTVMGHGVGADVLGHPLDALAWLANHLSQRGRHLHAGDLVSLGSLTETRWLELGDRAAIEIEALGIVRLSYGIQD